MRVLAVSVLVAVAVIGTVVAVLSLSTLAIIAFPIFPFCSLDVCISQQIVMALGTQL